uniref:Zinc finger PHD-type domain-containing protein n=1 Tax=Gadus morhua TaxID=8049 RepID=A0A8C5D7G5_GADMO
MHSPPPLLLPELAASLSALKSVQSLHTLSDPLIRRSSSSSFSRDRTLSSTMANVSSQPGVSTSAESHGSDCAASASGQEETWCFCGQVEFGKMILRDNAKCHIKWFHYSCINVKVAPKGKWYCPKCQKLPKFEPKKGKKPLK